MHHSLWVWLSSDISSRWVPEGLFWGHDGTHTQQPQQQQQPGQHIVPFILMTPVGRAEADIEERPENALQWPSGSNKWSASCLVPGRRSGPAQPGRLPTSVKLWKEKSEGGSWSISLILQQPLHCISLAASSRLSHLLHFTHVRLCRSTNWMHPVFRRRPTYTVPTRPWLRPSDNLSRVGHLG